MLFLGRIVLSANESQSRWQQEDYKDQMRGYLSRKILISIPMFSKFSLCTAQYSICRPVLLVLSVPSLYTVQYSICRPIPVVVLYPLYAQYSTVYVVLFFLYPLYTPYSTVYVILFFLFIFLFSKKLYIFLHLIV